MKEDFLRKIVGFILIIFSIIYLIPVFYAINLSLKSMNELYTNPFGLPSQIEWENYPEVWRNSGLDSAFCNSLIVATATIILTLTVCSLAAYSFSTFQFKGRRAIFLSFIIGLALPWPAFLFAIFSIMRSLNLINNLISVILMHTALNIPFSILVLTGFFATIPKDYIDAARIDGASELTILLKVFLPLTIPIMVTVATLVFSNSWNEFMFALVLLQRREVRTIPVALLDVQMQYQVKTNYLMAASVIATIIPLIIFTLFYRRIVEGLTVGLKG